MKFCATCFRIISSRWSVAQMHSKVRRTTMIKQVKDKKCCGVQNKLCPFVVPKYTSHATGNSTTNHSGEKHKAHRHSCAQFRVCSRLYFHWCWTRGYVQEVEKKKKKNCAWDTLYLCTGPGNSRRSSQSPHWWSFRE